MKLSEIVTKGRSLGKRIGKMEIPLYAANAGFFIVLAIFPALLLILSILRYTPLDAYDLLALLDGILPAALMPTVENLVVSAYSNTSTAIVSVSALGTLWSASKGVYGLLRGLNAIYDVEESRSYFHTRLLSIAYTLILVAAILLTLVLNVFGEAIQELLSEYNNPLWDMVSGMLNLRGLVMPAVLTVIFTAMFVWLPNRRNSFRRSLPGGLLAALGWLIFSELFSLYVSYFPNYSNIYGSVYALVLGMLWLYICLAILFYGGALNKLLTEK